MKPFFPNNCNKTVFLIIVIKLFLPNNYNENVFLSNNYETISS